MKKLLVLCLSPLHKVKYEKLHTLHSLLLPSFWRLIGGAFYQSKYMALWKRAAAFKAALRCSCTTVSRSQDSLPLASCSFIRNVSCGNQSFYQTCVCPHAGCSGDGLLLGMPNVLVTWRNTLSVLVLLQRCSGRFINRFPDASACHAPPDNVGAQTDAPVTQGDISQQLSAK